MFRHHLNLFIRTINKDKITFFINIFGLSVGIACCLVIFLFVKTEYSFDQFHSKSENIYRIILDYRGYLWDCMPGVVGERIINEKPKTLLGSRHFSQSFTIKTNNKLFKEQITFADPDFFNIFDFPIINGNKSFVFDLNNNIVLSKNMSLKYFGEVNPIGEIISIKIDERFIDFIVSGVLENAPTNSSIQYSMLIPFDNIKLHPRYLHTHIKNFLVEGPECYFRFNNEAEINLLKSMLTSIIPLVASKNPGQSWNTTVDFYFQPIKDIHFAKDIASNQLQVSNILYSKILIGIAILIILIASINYINLSLTLASKRYTEIGIRKVSGASRKKLFLQFIGESVSLTIFTSILAFGLSKVILFLFSNLLSISLISTYNFNNVIFFLIFLTGLGVLSGLYPALYLSNFKPTSILKKLQINSSFTNISKVFIVIQFALSLILLTCVFIMKSQVYYINNKYLGFNQNQKIILYAENISYFEASRFKTSVLNNPYIRNATISNASPILGPKSRFYVSHNDINEGCAIWRTDKDFIKTLELPLLSGELKSNHSSDNTIIVNEELVKRFQLKDPINTWVSIMGIGYKRITGVVNDFHFRPLHYQIEPVVILNSGTKFNYIIIDFVSSNVRQTISEIKNIWDESLPNYDFDFTFLDEKVNQLYKSEFQWTTIITIAASIAIMIASFGLFGLTRIVLTNRTKEIGIRKVYGASIASLINMLTLNFIKWIVIANIIAWPIAYYFMNKWLQNFEYRIDLTILPFLFAGFFSILTAIITVCWQTIRTAVTNPIESLKYE